MNLQGQLQIVMFRSKVNDNLDYSVAGSMINRMFCDKSSMFCDSADDNLLVVT